MCGRMEESRVVFRIHFVGMTYYCKQRAHLLLEAQVICLQALEFHYINIYIFLFFILSYVNVH